ncbi:unnamed protein product [Paramecium sonneborni]|uniref:Uncharacterized protein n=1 Tax=Paramecium sonneborni TaxID=65129 RepID=A0A8S1RV10_9CILI|nr:unnamed protein product [Paramecium sonneborni]
MSFYLILTFLQDNYLLIPKNTLPHGAVIKFKIKYYIKYKATQSLASSDFIDVLIPIREIKSILSLKILNTNNLNTAIKNGQSFGYLDKVGILDTYFKFYLYQGIADFQRQYSFVRMINFTSCSLSIICQPKSSKSFQN